MSDKVCPTHQPGTPVRWQTGHYREWRGCSQRGAGVSAGAVGSFRNSDAVQRICSKEKNATTDNTEDTERRGWRMGDLEAGAVGSFRRGTLREPRRRESAKGDAQEDWVRFVISTKGHEGTPRGELSHGSDTMMNTDSLRARLSRRAARGSGWFCRGWGGL